MVKERQSDLVRELAFVDHSGWGERSAWVRVAARLAKSPSLVETHSTVSMMSMREGLGGKCRSSTPSQTSEPCIHKSTDLHRHAGLGGADALRAM